MYSIVYICIEIVIRFEIIVPPLYQQRTPYCLKSPFLMIPEVKFDVVNNDHRICRRQSYGTLGGNAVVHYVP